MYENWQKLSKISQEEIQILQNKKLKHLVKHQLPFHPYYRELFKKHKISFSDIKTTDDLVKIPFTTKADVAPTEDDRARPKKFVLQPDEKLIKKHAPKSKLIKILWHKVLGRDVKLELEREYKPIHLHFTTGRTALPTLFGYSAYDLENLKESGRRMFDVVSIPRETIAVNAFPYSPHLAFWLTYHALTSVGVTSLSTGGGKVMGTKKIIDAIERMKAQLLVFIPGYAYHLLREAAGQNRNFSNVKYIFFGGERVSNGLREKVKELLRQMGAQEVKILATYALTESKTAWIQCAENTGYHLYPDLEFLEVVDKEGKRVKPGDPGEIVYTALDWRGSVVVRYKTGDMCRGISYEPCPSCGKTVPRIYPDIQRKSDIKEFQLTKIKGELINLNNFYPLLSGMQEIEEWQVEIKKKNNDPYEIDEVLVHVALKQGVDFENFKPILEKRIQNEIFITPQIIKVELDGILKQLGMETELKEKRVVDNRPEQK